MSAAFYISPPVSVSRRRWCAGVTYCYHGNTGGQVWLKRGSEFWISLDIFSELTSLYSGGTVIYSSPSSVFWTWRSPGYKTPGNSSWWKVRRATSEGTAGVFILSRTAGGEFLCGDTVTLGISHSQSGIISPQLPGGSSHWASTSLCELKCRPTRVGHDVWCFVEVLVLPVLSVPVRSGYFRGLWCNWVWWVLMAAWWSVSCLPARLSAARLRKFWIAAAASNFLKQLTTSEGNSNALSSECCLFHDLFIYFQFFSFASATVLNFTLCLYHWTRFCE